MVKQSNYEKLSAAEGLSYENYVLHNLFRQMSFYTNGTLVSTSNDISSYASYNTINVDDSKVVKEHKRLSYWM